MSKVVILYMPALHDGYIRFLKNHAVEKVYLVSDEIRSEIEKEIPYYGRDIRAVPSVEMLKVVRALKIVEAAELTKETILQLNKTKTRIIMPREDISFEIIRKYFTPGQPVEFETVFLRWDKQISTKELEISPNRVWSLDETDKKKIQDSLEEADRSSDWWRRIGAIIYKNGKCVVSAHNTHLPRPDSPSVLGDPRSNFDAGESIEVSTAIHAEAAAIAEAAQRGIALKDTELYVSTFPCPNCARLIVRSGIRKVFYAKGYSLVDAEDILKNAGVEIVMVKI